MSSLPDRDPPASRSRNSGFQARIKGASLADLVQMECLSNLQSVVQVAAGGDTGHLYFRAGGLVHATTGSLAGEAAAMEMLTWRKGTFDRVEREWPIRENMACSWQGLLLRAAQLSDEEHGPNAVAFRSDGARFSTAGTGLVTEGLALERTSIEIGAQAPRIEGFEIIELRRASTLPSAILAPSLTPLSTAPWTVAAPLDRAASPVPGTFGSLRRKVAVVGAVVLVALVAAMWVRGSERHHDPQMTAARLVVSLQVPAVDPPNRSDGMAVEAMFVRELASGQPISPDPVASSRPGTVAARKQRGLSCAWDGNRTEGSAVLSRKTPIPLEELRSPRCGKPTTRSCR